MKIITFLILVTNLLFANMGEFKVSYDPDYAPYTYNVGGKPYGLFIDIYNKWAKANNYKLEFVDANTWDNAIDLVKDGKVDLFIGTDPYEEWMKSSKPYYETKTALFALNSEADSFKNIGIIGEDLKEDILKKFPDVNVLSYDTYSQLLNGLLEKKLDAIYDDSIALNDFILKQNKSHLIKKLNIISNSSVISAISNDQKKADLFTKGFSKINKNELISLENNWIFNENQKYFSRKQNLENIFTADEKQWMKENPIVKFAVMNYWPHDDDGESFHTAMLKLINEYIGTNFIPVKYDAWSDGFGMASSGTEIHGIMGLSYSKEREEKYFHYTPAYYFSPSYIVVKDTNSDIKDLSDLENKTIYLKSKSISHKIISSNLKNTKVVDLSTIDEMYKNLATSTKVDAFVSYFVDKKLLKKYNLKIAKTMYEKYGETSIGVHHNYPLLASILEKAYTLIPKTQIASLRDKRWGESKVTNSELSPKQISYLKNKKVLKICTNPNWAPIEFIKDGETKGISIDLLSYMQDTLNLKYEYVKSSSWSQSQQFLKEKKCDILPSAIKTAKREKYAKFTNPYLSYDLAIVTRDDKPLSQTIDDFLDKTMSRKKGSGLISAIKRKYPTIEVLETKDTKGSFEAVIDGDVDFTITTLPVLQYYKSKYGLKGLQVVGYTKMKYDLRIAVRNDQQILTDILNVSLSKLSPQTYKIIHDKWANVKVVHQTNWKLILEIVLVVFAIFILILWYNRKLKLMVQQKTADIDKQKSELEVLINSFDKNVIFSRTDLKGNITHISEAFCNISGYSYDELIGQPHNIVRHPDMKPEVFKEIWTALQSGSSIKAEVKNRRKDGSSYWVESKFDVDYDSDGNIIGYSALRVDITNRKKVQNLSANLEIKVEERTKELNDERKFIDSVMNSQSSIVMTTDGKSIRTVNKAFLDFFNVKDIEEFQEKFGDCICDTFDSDSSDEYLKKETNGLSWIEYIKQNEQETHKTIITLNNIKYIFSIASDSFIFNNIELMTIVFNDITELKKIQEDNEAIHKLTRESIEYASLIQSSILPDNNHLRKYFNDQFIIWHPKDTVGGDIYLFNELRNDDECLLCYIDCTGHGVPGAFVTMLVKAVETSIISEILSKPDMDVSPAWILSYFNKNIKQLLKQDDETSVSNAGFDGGIIYYNKKDKILKFAGAETPLFYVDTQDNFHVVKGDRYSVGYKKCAMDYEYKETIINVQEGMKFYCTTDGYLDQNGGEKDFPFGKKRFANIIKENYKESMADQQEMFLYEMGSYENMIEDNDRNDDMTVIGFEI